MAEQCEDSEGGKSLQSRTVDTLMSRFGVEKKVCSPEELKSVKQLLHKNIAGFSQGETELGRTPREIDTGDAKPIKMHTHTVPLMYRKR